MSGMGEFPAGASLPHFDVNSTAGAILIGGLITAVLYGMTIQQTLTYYQHSKQDNWFFKTAVFVLWSLDTFDMFIIAHILYHYTITNYGNPAALAMPVWSVRIHLLVTAVTEVVVRAMFTWRIWKLSQEKWLPVIIVCFVNTLDLTFGIVVTVKSFGKTFAQLLEIQGFVFTEFGTALSGDFLVVLFLCYYLHQSRTGMSRTESLINILMVYVINTGLLTVIALTVNVALFATQQKNFAFVAVYFIISKLYVNAYLAMLNARDHLRERADEIVSIHLSRLSDHSSQLTRPISNAPPPRRTSDKFQSPMSIRVDTDVDRDIPDQHKSHFSAV